MIADSWCWPCTVARRAREHGDDDLRAESANDPHGVLQDLFARPESERLLDALREPEVVGAREVLPRAVQLACGVELLRAGSAQADAELRPDQVLTPVAPGERQVRRLSSHASGDELSGAPCHSSSGMRRDDRAAAGASPASATSGSMRREASVEGGGQRRPRRVHGEGGPRGQARGRKEKEEDGSFHGLRESMPCRRKK